MPYENNYFYFINRSFYIASLLSERLEELNGQLNDPALEEIFNQAISALKTQISVTRGKIVSIGETDSLPSAQPVINLLKSIFNYILQPGCDIQYIHLYDYLSLADCMMAETGRFAQITGRQTPTSEYYSEDLCDLNVLKPALNFLRENFLTAATV